MSERKSRLLFPLALSAALFGLYWFVRVEPKLAGKFAHDHVDWLNFVALIPLIFFGVRLFDFMAFDLVMSRRRNVVAPSLLREIFSIVLYFVLFGIAITYVLGQPVTGWLATGTILAAVIGLALQETLGNLVAGIALHLEDSFEVGDVIRSGDFIGVVEGVRWRATRLRTFNNDFVILPNSMIARERLEVFPRDNLNARVLSVSVDYNVQPATAIAVLTQAMTNVDGVARDIPCFARVGGFGDFAVIYELKYFMRDYAQRDRIDADIRKAVWYALRRNGISIPFPIRAYQPYKPPTHEDRQIPPDELRARLMEVDILSPLTPDAHEAIASAAKVHFFSKGETIIRHGTAGDSMFVVHEGIVSVRIPDESSVGWHEVARLVAGSVFGEMALLTGETRTADIAATTDVMAIEITHDALQPILQSHPELAAALSAKMLERQDRLAEIRADSGEEEARTVLSRIRAYFGL